MHTQMRPTPSPVPPSRSHSRRMGISVFVTALSLILFIILGGLAEQHLLEGNAGAALPTSTIKPHLGPFVQPPLNGMHLDALRHLVTHMQYKQLASLYVAHMTLDEELGQLIMVEYADTYYSPDLDMMINQLHAGGIIMYEFQMLTFNQTKHDIALMQQHTKIPLLISTDEVHRLLNIYPPRPSAISIYNTGNLSLAAQQGHNVAHDLLALGINENLAPDVDVELISGPDQALRTFGYTTNSVISFAGAYMRAMQGDGVVACIKHYPGLGDANIDAHFGLPVVNRTKDQLYAVELAPYKAFIQSPNNLGIVKE